MPLANDYTGQKFGRLIAISYTGKHSTGKNKKRIWSYKCDCGKLCEKVAEKVVKGDVKSCGCLKTTRTPQESLIYSVFGSDYRDGDLTERQFITLSRRPCWVCGSEVSETGSVRYGRSDKTLSFRYHGLDRIDNNLPHNFDNVLPCCWNCNEWRKDRTMERFLNKIETAYRNLVKIGKLPKRVI